MTYCPRIIDTGAEPYGETPYVPPHMLPYELIFVDPPGCQNFAATGHMPVLGWTPDKDRDGRIWTLTQIIRASPIPHMPMHGKRQYSGRKLYWNFAVRNDSVDDRSAVRSYVAFVDLASLETVDEFFARIIDAGALLAAIDDACCAYEAHGGAGGMPWRVRRIEGTGPIDIYADLQSESARSGSA